DKHCDHDGKCYQISDRKQHAVLLVESIALNVDLQKCRLGGHSCSIRVLDKIFPSFTMHFRAKGGEDYSSDYSRGQ
ncbi:MAG: hypothetical protein ABFC65_01515, partial [Rectinema sp.]